MLALLLPYEIIDLYKIYIDIIKANNDVAFDLLLNYIELTQEEINKIFKNDYGLLKISKVLIDRGFYPDDETFEILSQYQKFKLKRFMDSK